MYMAEHIPPDIAAAKADHHLPGVLNYMAGHIGQVVDYSPVPAPLDRLLKLWVFFPRAFWPIIRRILKAVMDNSRTRKEGVPDPYRF